MNKFFLVGENMQNHLTFNWETKDQYQIFAQKWVPSNEPKAVTLIVHGLGEHSSRYEHVAQFLNGHNCAVYSFDHRGHGKSSGSRGDIPSYKIAGDDIDSLIQFIQKDFPTLPIFLYGHSLGGAIVLYYGLTRNTSAVKGIICTSPGLASGVPVPPLKLRFAKIMAAIAPKITVNNGLDVENISHDKAVVEKYNNDPLVHPLISARLAMELVSKGEWMIANANQFKYPLLLLQGGKDHLVDPKATASFARAASQINILYKEFPEFFHEMHNETGNSEFLNTIVSWLNEQIAK
jgi:alpha-beta hydrolase superfamily lysophospholipase